MPAYRTTFLSLVPISLCYSPHLADRLRRVVGILSRQGKLRRKVTLLSMDRRAVAWRQALSNGVITLINVSPCFIMHKLS